MMLVKFGNGLPPAMKPSDELAIERTPCGGVATLLVYGHWGGILPHDTSPKRSLL